MHERPGQQNKQRLTPKQEEVLALIARGHTNFEIAQRLGLSLEGVKYHVSEILGKLEVESREEAAAWWQARQRPWSRVARRVRGLVGVPLVMRVGVGVVGAVAAVGVVVGLGLLRADDAETLTADEILEASREVMATESFSCRRADCDDCPPTVTLEYAPPNRLKVSNSPSAPGDYGWPFYYFDAQRGYYSEEGQRWTEEPSEGANYLLSDPRAVFGALKTPSVDGSDTLEGRTATVIAAGLDGKKYLSLLPPALGIEADADILTILDQVGFRFWVDAGNHRVLQMEVIPPEGEGPGPIIRFDYITEVNLPDAVESLPAADAQRLGWEAQAAGEKLLIAIEEHHRRTGAYPSSLDAATVPGLEPPWPRNPFTGQPMRDSRNAGDFEYRVKDTGASFEFTLRGWSGVLMRYDSARWGPVDLAAGRPDVSETAP